MRGTKKGETPSQRGTYNFWAWLIRLYSTLICGERQKGDAGMAGDRPAHPRPPHPWPAWAPAEMGVTSYFCCFSFAIRSNFSDSSWWIQSDSSWALSLAGQMGCHGDRPGHTLGSERLRELSKATQCVSEFGVISAILRPKYSL